MKPDDEYEDIEDVQSVGGSRIMSWLVLAVAIGGFTGLAFYAYNSGNQATEDGNAVTIEADATPFREAPADPEGEQFANKDKTIYDVIAPDGSPTAEKMMPDPERPVAAMDVEDEDSIAAAQEPAATAATPAAVAPTPAAAATPATAAPTTYVAESEAKKSEVAEVVPPAVKPAATASNPRMINETAVGEKPEPAKAAPPKVVKPVVKAEAKPAAGGSYKVQLGAFKSEAEAQSAWKKISTAHSGVLSGAPTIVKADLPNGTFYRLRSGSYASSADAKAVCAKLAPQACMAVK